MTAKKISQLPDLGAAPAATDELVIVDSGVTKKVSVEDLFTNIDVTGTATLSGGTNVANRTTFGVSGFWDAVGTGNNKGLKIGGAGLYPTDGTGAALDATLDIGTSGARFKDLYLSGGVYLGGTGAANHLDDYEEGTWTPTVSGDATGVIEPATTGGYYTKVGNQVTVYFNFKVTTNFTNSYIGGLPFQINHLSLSSSWITGGSTIGMANNTVLAGLQNGLNTFRLYEDGNLNNPHEPNTTVEYYRFQFSYRTDS